MVERIREILSKYQLTPTQFADAIGTARPIVSHILSGRNKPSLDVIQKTVAAFPDLSLQWLLNGVGAMEATVASSAAQVETTKSPPRPTEKPATARINSKQPYVAAQAVEAPEAFAVPVPVVAPVMEHQPALVTNEVAEKVAPQAAVATMPPATPVATAVAATESFKAPAVAPPALQAFMEPGKAIRRIVIFYTDGTFSDYQPETPIA